MRAKTNIVTRRRGQVLLIGVVLMLFFLIMIFFMFDLSQTVKLRAKSQTSTDSAALTAAAWQGRSLNMIGELNLIKATQILTTYPDYEPDKTALENHGENLKIVSELQARVAYVGPLLGFATAQQAAKNNGLRNNSSYGSIINDHIEMHLIDDADFTYDDVEIDLPYDWVESYRLLLENVKSQGIAALPVNNRFLMTIPLLTSNSPLSQNLNLLMDPAFYGAVHANWYCYFYRRGLEPGASIVIDDIEVEIQQASSFIGSEYLPLYVELASSALSEDNLTLLEQEIEKRTSLDRLQTASEEDDEEIAVGPGWTKTRYNLSEVQWAKYEIGSFWSWGLSGDAFDDGQPYDVSERMANASSPYNEMNRYLRGGGFKPQYIYGGACARFEAGLYPDLLTGNWRWKHAYFDGDEGDNEENEQEDVYLGDELSWSDTKLRETPSISDSASMLKNSEKRLESLRENASVRSSSCAKPFGSLNDEFPPQYAADIVLPVFKDVRLIPVSLGPRNKKTTDWEIFKFIKDYFGNPDYPDIPPDVMAQLESEYAYYLNAIEMFNDPNSGFNAGWEEFDVWRTEYMAGEDLIPGTGDDIRDPCLPRAPSGGGGGGGGGPGALH